MADLDPDPHLQFDRWFQDARGTEIKYPEAMTLATATPDGVPSARMVLLKGHDHRGFVFYTNRESRKGRELQANARAALVLHWAPLERQVRVEGAVERVSDEESLAYFRTRPLGSRLGAWASPQSSVVSGREALERLYAEAERRFSGSDDVPLPPHWGGYRVIPSAIEFWQGQRNRLHDRVRYERSGDGWTRERLGP
jgi:pyridoxamine 5'-phosphate oxidase